MTCGRDSPEGTTTNDSRYYLVDSLAKVTMYAQECKQLLVKTTDNLAKCTIQSRLSLRSQIVVPRDDTTLLVVRPPNMIVNVVTFV